MHVAKDRWESQDEGSESGQKSKSDVSHYCRANVPLCAKFT